MAIIPSRDISKQSRLIYTCKTINVDEVLMRTNTGLKARMIKKKYTAAQMYKIFTQEREDEKKGDRLVKPSGDSTCLFVD